jgi:hypothetical protein
LQYVKSHLNVADGLTKGLARQLQAQSVERLLGHAAKVSMEEDTCMQAWHGPWGPEEDWAMFIEEHGTQSVPEEDRDRLFLEGGSELHISELSAGGL